MSPALAPLTPRTNVWLETDGEVALSRWRVELLQAIDRSGSISAAAEIMNIQYRLAWQRVHEMEERLGLSLVHTTTGGAGGGGATLTPTARDLIDRFLALADAVNDFTAQQAQRFFAQ
jgi:molybdate transport system regulatory protein